MSGKRRDLSPDEKKLWRRVAASVKARKPLPPEPETAEAEPPPARTRVKAASKVTPEPKAKAPAAKTVAPQDRGNEKRVRRGKLEIDAKLDLHGHNQDTGRAALIRFLHTAQRRGDRTVIVITGVGRGGEGVLKRRLPEWLSAAEVSSLLAGFAPAHRTHGGAGAFYVFLKRANETRG